MISLFPYLGLLALAAMLFVLVPLLRYREVAAKSTLEQRKQKNREVFAQRTQELADDLAQGLVSADEHEKLLAELQRRQLVPVTLPQALGATRSAAA